MIDGTSFHIHAQQILLFILPGVGGCLKGRASICRMQVIDLDLKIPAWQDILLKNSAKINLNR